MNSETHSWMDSLASFAILPFSGTPRRMMRPMLAIGRNRSCSLAPAPPPPSSGVPTASDIAARCTCTARGSHEIEGSCRCPALCFGGEVYLNWERRRSGDGRRWRRGSAPLVGEGGGRVRPPDLGRCFLFSHGGLVEASCSAAASEQGRKLSAPIGSLSSDLRTRTRNLLLTVRFLSRNSRVIGFSPCFSC